MNSKVQPIDRPTRKIPRSEWARISERHSAGEALTLIARDYNCTAPAIRYIIRQSVMPVARDRVDAAGQAWVEGSEITKKYKTPLPGEGGLVSAITPLRKPVVEPESGREGSKTTGFNSGLRDAMILNVSAFLVALDTATNLATDQDLDELRDATDRLLRAVARIRIELERLRRPPRSKARELSRKASEIRKGE